MEIKIDQKEVKEIIDTRIRLAIAEALGKDSGVLVEKIVDVALAQKNNSYDNRTILQTALISMINEAAKEAFKEWIASRKPEIQNAVLKRLRADKNGFVEKVADQLVNGMASNFYVSVSLKTED